VAGVGRSGTTAVYEALQALARRQRQAFRCFYEPYLWGPPTWAPRFRDIARAFGSTRSLHAEGLRTHLATPLFASELGPTLPDHLAFVRSLFPPDRSSLVKIIRGCGRLRDYLEAVPDLKLVLVTRNPLDCVNSILENFSFYGDEFHPSDQPRFFAELRALGRRQPTFASEAEASLAWWREMNAAAFRTLAAWPGRAFILPHEALKADRDDALRRLAAFLDVAPAPSAGASLARPVGQISKGVNLRADDRDDIAAAQAAYFRQMARVSDVPLPPGRALRAAIDARYADLAPGAFTPDSPRDASPLRIRAQLSGERRARRMTIEGLHAILDGLEALEPIQPAAPEAATPPARREAARRRRRRARRG
jgi:hypothetical protein